MSDKVIDALVKPVVRMGGFMGMVALWKAFGTFAWFNLPEPSYLQASGVLIWIIGL